MREQFFEKFLSQSFSENEYFLTADVGFKFLDALKKAFGNHFINVGIAEKNMLAIAAGLANEGKKVFCYSIGPFMTTEAYSILRNDIFYHDAKITMINGGAGLQYGAQGFSHHVYEDLNLLANFPELNLYQPSSEKSLDKTIENIRSGQKTNYVRLGWAYPHIPALSHQDYIQEVHQGKKATILVSGLTGQLVLDFVQKENLDLQVLQVDLVYSSISNSLWDRITNRKLVIIEECLFPGPLFKNIYDANPYDNKIESINLEIERDEIGSRDFMYDRQGFPLKRLRELVEKFD